MRKLRRLVQKEVLHDDAIHCRQGSGDMLRIGIRLRNILTLNVETFETPTHGRVEHIGDPHTGLFAQRDAPNVGKLFADGIVRDVPISHKLVGERSHVAGTLHVILSTERIHPHAQPADITRRHRQVRHGHDHR